MSDKPWKQFERDAAKLIGGGRYWANSGEAIDIGPDKDHPDCRFVGQAKLVKKLSLSELTVLTDEITRQGRTQAKHGVVVVKLRQSAEATRFGPSRQPPTMTLVVMAADTFTALCRGETPEGSSERNRP